MAHPTPHARRHALLAAAALAAATPLAPALAHHGWSGYDASRLLTLTGSVEQATFEQPHALLTLASEGKVWRVVLAPPSRMARRGLAAEAVGPGAEVTVEGYQNRTEADEVRAERISVGGKSYELR